VDRASADRAACLAGCVPAAPNWRICAYLQRRYLCKTRKIFGDLISYQNDGKSSAAIASKVEKA